MAVIDGRTWLEHLAHEECWRLLRATPVGRIGVLVDSAPDWVRIVAQEVTGRRIWHGRGAAEPEA